MAFAGFYIASRFNQPSTAKLQKENSGEWKTFRNDWYRYEIKYPAKWVQNYASMDGSNIIHFYETEDEVAIKTSREGQLSALDPEFAQGEDSGGVIVDFSCSDAPCEGINNLSFKRFRIELIVGRGVEPDRIEKYKHIFKQMLSTFRFVE